ncbi:MAG: VCBS repeat-containing protein [Desulfamplus sp.]|nr:VCBS repeat-containing protein [Desulfamplus sp.]
MKIASSQISFNAERKYEENHVSTREVEILEEHGNRASPKLSSPIRNKINITPRLFSAKTDVPPASPEDETPTDPKLAAMKRMLDAMMGKKIKLTDISGFQTDRTSTASSSSLSSLTLLSSSDSIPNNSLNSNAQSSQPTATPPRRVRITEFNSHYESEVTQFNALGNVKTESGESINFKLHLDMKREFYSENRSQIVGDSSLIDPLVVNFSGQPAELTDVKFKFDLNSDGKEEEIPWLSSGSGFLVFDKNQDGVVNNGKEMFGPASNNGFQELAQLDDDKNGWIDENDAAFEKLSIWSGDTPENAQLKSLKESGVGAIAVTSTETEFTIKQQQSQNTLGQIRRTGIYLEENGKAGTIQQLDLAI